MKTTTTNLNNEAIIRDYLDACARNQFLQDQRIHAIQARIPELSDIASRMDLAGTALVREKLAGDPDAQKHYRAAVDALEARRTRLLAENGLTPEDLAPHYLCPVCKDKGFVDGAMCDCLKQRIAEASFSRYDLKPLARKENFDTFRLDYYPDRQEGAINPRLYMEKILRLFKDYCAHFDQVADNFLFSGNPGLGKTFLTNCIAGALIAGNVNVVYTTASHLVRLVQDTIYGEGGSVNQLYQTLLDCDLLIIDDLGAEYGSRFSGNQLYEIINARLLSDRRMIISTNLTSREIMKQYDKRLSSRISGNFKPIPFYGDDIRLLKKRQ